MYKHLKVCIIGNGFHSKRIQKILRFKKIKFFIFKPKSKKNYKSENLNFLDKFNVFFIISPNKTHYHYIKSLHKKEDYFSNKYLICGGGRKNHFLIETINKYLNKYGNLTLENIDNFNQNGDFIESQAFGYLAIRSYLGLPITFPDTTRCNKPLTGGSLVKNF